MPSAVQISPPSGVGGLIQGLFGNYQQNSDGTFTVDPRDASVLLGRGASYMTSSNSLYTTPAVPAAASVGHIIASHALSNGTVAVSNQPDVMRQVALEIGNGTAPVTAGNVAVTYIGNDGQTRTENFPANLGASAGYTFFLSRGVTHISPAIVTAIAGGTSPFVRLNTTSAIAVPLDPNAVDYHTVAEAVTGVFETGGWTDSPVSIGCVTPNTVPDGTQTYSIVYGAVAPVV